MAYQKALLEAGKITYQQYSQYVSDELERMYKNGKISASKYYSAVKDMIDEQNLSMMPHLKVSQNFSMTKLINGKIRLMLLRRIMINLTNRKINTTLSYQQFKKYMMMKSKKLIRKKILFRMSLTLCLMKMMNMNVRKSYKKLFTI